MKDELDSGEGKGTELADYRGMRRMRRVDVRATLADWHIVERVVWVGDKAAVVFGTLEKLAERRMWMFASAGVDIVVVNEIRLGL